MEGIPFPLLEGSHSLPTFFYFHYYKYFIILSFGDEELAILLTPFFKYLSSSPLFSTINEHHRREQRMATIKNTQITIRISELQKKLIEDRAAKAGMNVAEYIRYLISKDIEK